MGGDWVDELSTALRWITLWAIAAAILVPVLILVVLFLVVTR